MPPIDHLRMHAGVGELLNRHAAVGLALGVVRDGSLDFFAGHGLADIASHVPVTEDTVFRVGSITKTFTAVAVMQLHERGIVDLDAPAAGYLRAYRLVPADPGWRPATVRHLLTHTAGIGEVLHPWGVVRPLFGETVEEGGTVPSLSAFYRSGLRIRAEPGTRFRYNDHGFATLGQIVEDVTGQPFDAYLREHVFAPLGMADTGLRPDASMRTRLATGYDLRSGGPRPRRNYDVVTAGGAAAYSTARDMARYVAALVGGGSNEHGSVLKPETLESMFAPQYQADPRLPGLGLALFRGRADGHAVVEHQGIVPSFASQIALAPDDGLALFTLTSGTRNGGFWLPLETDRLLRMLLGVPDEAIRTDLPQHPETWADLCGWYYLPGPATDVRARGFIGVGVEVFVRGGRLHWRCLGPVPALYRGMLLHPDHPEDASVFRTELPGLDVTQQIVFSRDPGTGARAIHFGLMPLSAYRQPAATDPRRWISGAAAAGTAAVVVRRRRRRRA